MTSYDYKAKIFEFYEEIKRLIIQGAERKEIEQLISLIHKMLFYAEQYFIDQELKFRNDQERLKKIRSERQDVINRLQTFANTINDFNSEIYQMLNFLENWKYKLNTEQQYA